LKNLSTLARFGGHQLIELRVLGEFIGKWYKAGADLDQSVTGIHIGDIGKLGVRDVQQFCKLQSVRGCLIEHNNELGVCQHRSCRVGLKQVVHILRDARGISTVLSHTLPKGEQEVCAVLVLEQKVDFINEDEGVLALSSVLRNTVQNRVEDDQHTDGHKLLAEVKDVIADQAVIRVHIGFLCKGVQRAVGKQLNGKSDFLRFWFGLLEKLRSGFERFTLRRD